MVKTTIREYGPSVIAGSENDEEIIPALGDGTAVPGDAVHILSTRKVAGTDVGASEFFTGILMESHITGTETAIVNGVACNVVIPKSGHRYRVRIVDMGGDKEIGQPLTFSATAGKFGICATVITGRCSLARPYLNTETVGEVRWD